LETYVVAEKTVLGLPMRGIELRVQGGVVRRKWFKGRERQSDAKEYERRVTGPVEGPFDEEGGLLDGGEVGMLMLGVWLVLMI